MKRGQKQGYARHSEVKRSTRDGRGQRGGEGQGVRSKSKPLSEYRKRGNLGRRVRVKGREEAVRDRELCQRERDNEEGGERPPLLRRQAL